MYGGIHFNQQELITQGYDDSKTALPITLPEGTRPDWAVTEAFDPYPEPPFGDTTPCFVVVDGIEYVTTYNSNYAPWRSPSDEVMSALQHFDSAGLDWRKVLPRFFAIFYDQDVAVFDGGGSFEYISLPSKGWREATGAERPADQDDSFSEWRGYHNDETYTWTLWTLDAGLGEYIAEETVGGIYGIDASQDLDHVLWLFGKSADQISETKPTDDDLIISYSYS